MTSITLKNLSIGYRTSRLTRVVAEGINACINTGELTCLLGQNGIGKSTLLRTLSAFQPPLGGEVLIGERNIADYTDQQLAQTVGIVLTERPDVQHMTVSDLVALGRSPYTGFWGRLSADDHRIAREAMELVGISGLAKRLVNTLSDGERQKAMIAKAIAQQTPVIFLDEPTAFLDYPSKIEMLLLLRRIATEQQKTIFLSTHDLELSLQTADRIWLLTPDRGLVIGAPHEPQVLDGLSAFIDRPGVKFCPDTLSVEVVSSPEL